MQTGPPLGVFSQTVQACAFDFSPERGLASGGQIWIKQAQRPCQIADFTVSWKSPFAPYS